MYNCIYGAFIKKIPPYLIPAYYVCTYQLPTDKRVYGIRTLCLCDAKKSCNLLIAKLLNLSYKYTWDFLVSTSDLLTYVLW